MSGRKQSIRPHSTNTSKRTSVSSGTGVSQRKVSSVVSSDSGLELSQSSRVGGHRKSLIDDGQLEGKIKVSSAIRNSDLCISTNYRADGRYYAVALAEGVINVYSSKSENILYQLNKDDKELPFTDVSATCVRFRPFQLQSEQQAQHEAKAGRRKSSVVSAGSGDSDSTNFLPPIVSPKSAKKLIHHPFNQRRRKSSIGKRPEELGLFLSEDEKVTPNNMVTASFTDGSVKTFNFVTEQCVSDIKENREILTIGYNRSGTFLATGGSDGCIHVYDDDTKALTCSHRPAFEYKTELLRTYAITFHPHSNFEFVSGGWNKYIQFYDVRVPNLLVCKVAGPKICGEGLDFHPSGNEFCAASWGKREGVRLYDYAMREPFKVARSPGDSLKTTTTPLKKPQSQPPSFLYSARYFMDNYIAYGGSYSGGMTVIERHSEKNIVAGIHDLKKSIYCIDTFKSKILFVVNQEVCVSEVFL